MASAAAYDAIHDYLVANFTVLPLVFENQEFPPDASPFVFVEMFGDLYAQESIGAPGANLWRERGTVMGHVMVPNDSGSRQARVLARQFADLFREVEVAGIRFRDMSIGAGEPGDRDGNYFRMTASIDFERDDS